MASSAASAQSSTDRFCRDCALSLEVGMTDHTGAY
jgi:hypothetical protein